MLHDLYTPWGQELADHPELIPWEEYPRPRMRREAWQNLNGNWEFAVSPTPTPPEEFPMTIRVPFAPESLLSGIGRHFAEGSYLFYRRSVKLPEEWADKRILLHIGAADQMTEVFWNGESAGSHTGGYEPMTFGVRPAPGGENQVIIRVWDDLRSHVLPYGKQVMNRGGMWYTPVSGIWQTVWLEAVPRSFIDALEVDATPDRVIITTGEYCGDGTVTIRTPHGPHTTALKKGCAVYLPREPRLWSPEDPYLYSFVVEAGEDRVESYFAIRTLGIEQVKGLPRLLLNGKPFFFHGLLDQGYWSDGLLTPPSPACYEWDIQAMKKLGFNTLRKHIKVEPELFYYECDRLGMLVFQDMVNNGEYSFLRDTALPTVGLQKLPDKNLHRDPATRVAFLSGMEATVNRLKYHPSVVYWTIFNEGWGQFDSDRVYERLLELDDTRFVDTTSGWFRGHKTQVDSRHIYFRPLNMKASDKPLVLSEFGGYSYKPAGHVFNDSGTYGYRKFSGQEEFARAVEELYRKQVLPLVKRGLCAAIYTQVSDVEDETNGLVTYDRRVEKLTPERMMPIAQALYRAMED